MKIAFVTPEFVTEPTSYDGGLSNYLLRVSLALQKLGHTPIIIVENKEVTQVFHYRGIEVHRVKVNYQDIGFKLWKFLNYFNIIKGAEEWLYSSYVLNRYLLEIIKANKIDIVQYASYRATGYYRIKIRPSVVRISSYEPLYQKEKGDEVNSSSIKAESSAYLSADGVFGPSRLIAKLIEKDLDLSVSIIETPFELDTFKKDYDDNVSKLLKNKKYLLYWGSLGTIKGVDLIVKIIPEILKKYRDICFVFIGKHIDRKTELEVVRESFPNNVFIHGPMPHSSLYPVIEDACAAVLPSRADNFPNTCIEGMAFGKVVIGTRGTSFEQLIDDGVSGILCQKDDPEDLQVAVERVLNMSEEERKGIGKNAKKRIEQLRPEKVVVELVEFYKKVIDKYNNEHV